MAEHVDLSTLLDAREVPTPPTAAIRVLEIKNNPDACVDDLVEVVQQDPGLAAKLLSTANSPMYRRGDEITTVDRAVAMIGFRSVITIALAFSVASTMPATGTIGGIPMAQFWKRSVMTSATARLIARELAPTLAEEAFLVGLIAGLGRVVMGLVVPEEYEPLANEFHGWPTLRAEAGVFDFSSATATAGLLRQWSMPTLFSDAADRIESIDPGPVGSSPEDDIARCVRLAMAITEFYVGGGDGGVLRDLTVHGTEYGISAGRMDELLDEAAESSAQFSADFGVAPSVAEYDSIVTAARGQLVELTLQADAAFHEEHLRRTELEQANSELEAQARQDPLTGLANRRAFDEQLLQQLTLRIRDPHSMAKPMGIVMIDLDKFKLVNDNHGHPAGDAVLVKLAEILKMTTRTEEVVARFGGEEFILLAPLTTAEELVKGAERIRATIELIEVEIPSGERLKITASFGVATMAKPQSEDDGALLIKAADEALYEAKETGRNKVCLSPAVLGRVD